MIVSIYCNYLVNVHYIKGKLPKTSSIVTKENAVFAEFVNNQHVFKDKEFARRPERPRIHFVFADIEFVSQSKNKEDMATMSLGSDISF